MVRLNKNGAYEEAKIVFTAHMSMKTMVKIQELPPVFARVDPQWLLPFR